MSGDMVKKSVDITEEDEKWLQDSYVNFSKFCRRKLAERRAEDLRSHVKQKLHKQIQGMAEKGSELRDEWSEEKEELKDEYNAEIVEKQPEYFIFEIEGERFSGHWHPDAVFEDYPKELTEEAREFGQKFVDTWFDKMDRFGEYVNEETSFEVVSGDELDQDLEGTGYMDRFTIHVPYVPQRAEQFTVKFESRVDIDVEDLEEDDSQ